jgi:hypothetical protein
MGAPHRCSGGAMQQQGQRSRVAVCASGGAPVRRLCSALSSSSPLRRPTTAAQAPGQQQQQPRRRRHATTVRAASASPSAATSPPPPLPEGFDLGTAVAMAAAAFEAYLEPAGAALKDASSNGTLTTYTSRDFLLSAFDGVLEVTVERATGLKAVNVRAAAVFLMSFLEGGGLAGDDFLWGLVWLV